MSAYYNETAIKDGEHASAAGEGSIAASLGGGHAAAADTGAIVLTHWACVSNTWRLLGVFAGKSRGAQAAPDREDRGLQGQRLRAGVEGASSGLADAGGERRNGQSVRLQPGQSRQAGAETNGRGQDRYPSPTNGLWRDADWLFCRDGKWRPVEPGTFPLAHGATSRVGRLRGYGNAVCAPLAQGFIESVMEARP